MFLGKLDLVYLIPDLSFRFRFPLMRMVLSIRRVCVMIVMDVMGWWECRVVSRQSHNMEPRQFPYYYPSYIRKFFELNKSLSNFCSGGHFTRHTKYPP